MWGINVGPWGLKVQPVKGKLWGETQLANQFLWGQMRGCSRGSQITGLSRQKEFKKAGIAYIFLQSWDKQCQSSYSSNGVQLEHRSGIMTTVQSSTSCNPIMRQNEMRLNASQWLQPCRYGNNRKIHVIQCAIGLHIITLLYIRLHYSRDDLCCFQFIRVIFD